MSIYDGKDLNEQQRQYVAAWDANKDGKLDATETGRALFSDGWDALTQPLDSFAKWFGVLGGKPYNRTTDGQTLDTIRDDVTGAEYLDGQPVNLAAKVQENSAGSFMLNLLLWGSVVALGGGALYLGGRWVGGLASAAALEAIRNPTGAAALVRAVR